MTHMPKKAKTHRRWRNIWGVLALLALGWVGWTLSITGDAYSEGLESNRQMAEAGEVTYVDAADLGTTIGSGIAATVFLCTGVPALLFFLFMFWRNGVVMRREIHHAETIDAIRSHRATE